MKKLRAGLLRHILFYILLAILLSGILAGGAGCGKNGGKISAADPSGKPQARGKKEEVKDVSKIIPVIRTNITQNLQENGEIAPETSAEIKSRISGRIKQILVTEGATVKKGDIIAYIEPDLEQTKTITSLVNSLRQQEMAYKNAQEVYKQKEELYKRGFIAENEFAKAQDELDLADMNYKAGLEEYSLFKSELGVEKTISVERLSILSPIAGIVLKKDVEEGELITGESSARSGTLLFDIANLEKLVIKVNINEVDIYKVTAGHKVDIIISANPQKPYTGSVSKISPFAINKDGIKVFATEIRLDERDSHLRPGMSAVVKISLSARENVLAIPVTALFIDKDKEYVIVPDSRPVQGSTAGPNLAKKYVKRGINDEKHIEIVEGLTEGESIYSDIPFSQLEQLKGSIPAYNVRKEF
jgi:HlyD family secretion protein